jgi:hypothetical protein
MLGIYILSISLPTFHLFNFETVFLSNFRDILDPFSNDILLQRLSYTYTALYITYRLTMLKLSIEFI